MKEISATDAARRFSEMIDAVEHRHQSFVVVRGGHPVARVEPVASVSGKALKDVLKEHKPDRGWRQELADMRESLSVEERSWPV